MKKYVIAITGDGITSVLSQEEMNTLISLIDKLLVHGVMPEINITPIKEEVNLESIPVI